MTYQSAAMIYDNQEFGIARLVRAAKSARHAVLEHRRGRDEHPGQHRGCLWCEDGRLSHWLTDYVADPEERDAVGDVYDALYLAHPAPANT